MEIEILETKATVTNEMMVTYRIKTENGYTNVAHMFIPIKDYSEATLKQKILAVAEEYAKHKPKKYEVKV